MPTTSSKLRRVTTSLKCPIDLAVEQHSTLNLGEVHSSETALFELLSTTARARLVSPDLVFLTNRSPE